MQVGPRAPRGSTRRGIPRPFSWVRSVRFHVCGFGRCGYKQPELVLLLLCVFVPESITKGPKGPQAFAASPAFSGGGAASLSSSRRFSLLTPRSLKAFTANFASRPWLRKWYSKWHQRAKPKSKTCAKMAPMPTWLMEPKSKTGVTPAV